ncbi:hypothetical protein JX265_013633 [Neoarthrinium moseri]|uniref:Uncharacterized protein n=1 Tax=Neoarthrinium moseri TaxID=1658444 RepID=A0A9P9W873_9PEZI|nr:hypothetical protein JX265_013633 [Neoarthrinium moseri]
MRHRWLWLPGQLGRQDDQEGALWTGTSMHQELEQQTEQGQDQERMDVWDPQVRDLGLRGSPQARWRMSAA